MTKYAHPSGVLAEHDGTALEFELAFSAEVRLSYWKRKERLDAGEGRVDDDVGGRDAARADRLAGHGWLLAGGSRLTRCGWVRAATCLTGAPVG